MKGFEIFTILEIHACSNPRLRPRLHGTGPHGHDIKLNSFKTSVAPKSVIILQSLITTNHRKSGKSKDDLKLTELDVVTMRIRYRVNGV